MRTIRTKYLGPTNDRGSRVKATTISGRSVTLQWRPEWNTYTNHRAAAIALCRKLEWDGTWYLTDSNDGYLFVHLHPMAEPSFTLPAETPDPASSP